MCVLLPSGETQNYINIRKEQSRFWDRSGDDVDRIETLRRKYRKALNPTPIKGIDTEDSEKVLTLKLELLIKVILNCHPHYKML